MPRHRPHSGIHADVTTWEQGETGPVTATFHRKGRHLVHGPAGVRDIYPPPHVPRAPGVGGSLLANSFNDHGAQVKLENRKILGYFKPAIDTIWFRCLKDHSA